MKTLCILMSCIALTGCFKSAAHDERQTRMDTVAPDNLWFHNCSRVDDATTLRCENSEVVCYATFHYQGGNKFTDSVSCMRKEK